MKSIEASLKYFLTQALASTVILFSVVLLLPKSYLNFEVNSYIFIFQRYTIPLMFWLPNLMEGLTCINVLI